MTHNTTGTWAIANENGDLYAVGLSQEYANALVNEELNDEYTAPVFMMTIDGLLSNGNSNDSIYLSDYEFGDEDEARDALYDVIEPFCSTSEDVYAKNEEWIHDMYDRSYTLRYTFHAFNMAE